MNKITRKIIDKKWKFFISMCVVAFIAIGGFSILTNKLTTNVLDAQLTQKEVFPIIYEEAPSTASIPDGYITADYLIVDYGSFTDKEPGPDELTAEEVGDLAAQFIWEFFEDSIVDQTIFMKYDCFAEDSSLPIWFSWVNATAPERFPYRVFINSLTGDRWGIRFLREVENDGEPLPPIYPHEDFLILAKELVEEHNMLRSEISHSEVSFLEYGNIDLADPLIGITVTSVNGEEAILTFSRYDKVLLEAFYDPQLKC